MCKLLLILLISQVLWVQSNDQFSAPEDEEYSNSDDNSQDDQTNEEDIMSVNLSPPIIEEKIPEESRNLTPDEEDSPEEVAKHVLNEEYILGPRGADETTRPPAMSTKRYRVKIVQRSTKPPLECYSCTYRQGQSLRGCLDPVKYQEYTITCHSTDDVCYTSVEQDGPGGGGVRMVVRGCRSACVASPQWSCCEKNKCNMVVYQDTASSGRQGMSLVHSETSAAPADSPNAAFFVGVLLLLRTVLKIVFL